MNTESREIFCQDAEFIRGVTRESPPLTALAVFRIEQILNNLYLQNLSVHETEKNPFASFIHLYLNHYLHYAAVFPSFAEAVHWHSESVAGASSPRYSNFVLCVSPGRRPLIPRALL